MQMSKSLVGSPPKKIKKINTNCKSIPLCPCNTLPVDLRSLLLGAQNSFTPRLSLSSGGRWGTTDDPTASFLHFSLFFTVRWDLANSRPVHTRCCLPTSFFLSALSSSPCHCLARWYWRHVRSTSVCVSFRWPGGLL